MMLVQVERVPFGRVPWTMPGFSVDAYRDQLGALHEHIEREGSFIVHARRFLIETKKMA
jgi:hypothetical protein